MSEEKQPREKDELLIGTIHTVRLVDGFSGCSPRKIWGKGAASTTAAPDCAPDNSPERAIQSSKDVLFRLPIHNHKHTVLYELDLATSSSTLAHR
jgi:hypothetical protein